MLEVLYLGNDLRINTLLEKKGINVLNPFENKNCNCSFSFKNYLFILIDEKLYSNYVKTFPCLQHFNNIIVLYKEENKNNHLNNYFNVLNSYTYDYFLNNLNIILKLFLFEYNQDNNNNIEYVYNYNHLEEKIMNYNSLINIHLFDLGHYYINYGYSFLKKIIFEFTNNIAKILSKDYNMYILGNSDFFITTKKSKQDLKNIANEIITLFKFNTFNIDNIDIKFNFKIAFSQDENNLSLISKTLNNLNSTIEFNKLNEDIKDNLFIEQQRNFYLAKTIQKGFIDKNLITYYQPIINNETYEIDIYECLIRYKNNDISPREFIPILQKTNLTSLVTYTIIEQAFKKLSGSKSKISINICEEDLKNNKLIKFIETEQKKYGISSNRIIFEIKESFSSAKDNSFIVSQLKSLKESGFLIALDDFGINESNFSVIFEIDIDYIKIDGNFISKLKEKKYYKIVKSLVALANTLNITTIAEFVDQEDIQELVKKLGINYSQGYHIGKPKENI